MKQSHYTTPRTLAEAHFDSRGQALWGFQQRAEGVGNVIFATVLGALGALALVHWWAA